MALNLLYTRLPAFLCNSLFPSENEQLPYPAADRELEEESASNYLGSIMTRPRGKERGGIHHMGRSGQEMVWN